MRLTARRRFREMPRSWRLLVQGGVVLAIAVALIGTCDAAVDRTVPDSEFIESMQQTDAIFDELLQIGTSEFGQPDQQIREGYYCAGLGGPTGADRLELHAACDMDVDRQRRVPEVLDRIEELFESRTELSNVARSDQPTIVHADNDAVRAAARSFVEEFNVAATSRCGDPRLIDQSHTR